MLAVCLCRYDAKKKAEREFRAAAKLQAWIRSVQGVRNLVRLKLARKALIRQMHRSAIIIQVG